MYYEKGTFIAVYSDHDEIIKPMSNTSPNEMNKENEVANSSNISELTCQTGRSRLVNSNKKYYSDNSESEADPFSASGSEYQPSDESYERNRFKYSSSPMAEDEKPNCANFDNLGLTPVKVISSPISLKNEVNPRISSLLSPINQTSHSIYRHSCNIEQHPTTSDDTDTSKEISGNIYFEHSQKKPDGKRLYNKRHACYYCNKLIGKVTRHIKLVHKNETEIAKLLSMDGLETIIIIAMF
nr:uncharacterized protein LOC111516065 [Leptinotarsa decemlineata]